MGKNWVLESGMKEWYSLRRDQRMISMSVACSHNDLCADSG